MTAYAESSDGIRWTKPNLGLFRYRGSSDNNIVLGGDGRRYLPTDKWQGKLGTHTGLGWRGDMVPFIDTSPTVRPDARYKALVRGARGAHQIPGEYTDYGMYPFKSPDGLHWTLMSEKDFLCLKATVKASSNSPSVWTSHPQPVCNRSTMPW